MPRCWPRASPIRRAALVDIPDSDEILSVVPDVGDFQGQIRGDGLLQAEHPVVDVRRGDFSSTPRMEQGAPLSQES